ncbi:DUF1851 domain-containing protein [Amylibacter sp. SFDW26]|nr:DUF1851 domain-containing protein [Amylibacter sp. SFDW26]
MKMLELINEHWGWTGLSADRIVGRNEFGNLLILDDSGKYWRICPEELSCEVVAETSNEFSQLTEDSNFILDWEMSQIVEVARQSLGKLKEGNAYYLVFPGLLGGKYEADNIRTVSLSELIEYSGYLAREIKDLPDGAEIKLKVID